MIAPSEPANLEVRRACLEFVAILAAFFDGHNFAFQDDELGFKAVGALGVVYWRSLFDGLFCNHESLQFCKKTCVEDL